MAEMAESRIHPTLSPCSWMDQIYIRAYVGEVLQVTHAIMDKNLEDV